mmetsp:Transcript_4405/g.7640  ORF Transcript_4405/g.7640 Transcript_4405/m.7640 type:complete len:370 (-) Transcript_4405:537-1646(-)
MSSAVLQRRSGVFHSKSPHTYDYHTLADPVDLPLLCVTSKAINHLACKLLPFWPLNRARPAYSIIDCHNDALTLNDWSAGCSHVHKVLLATIGPRSCGFHIFHARVCEQSLCFFQLVCNEKDVRPDLRGGAVVTVRSLAVIFEDAIRALRAVDLARLIRKRRPYATHVLLLLHNADVNPRIQKLLGGHKANHAASHHHDLIALLRDTAARVKDHIFLGQKLIRLLMDLIQWVEWAISELAVCKMITQYLHKHFCHGAAISLKSKGNVYEEPDVRGHSFCILPRELAHKNQPGLDVHGTGRGALVQSTAEVEDALAWARNKGWHDFWKEQCRGLPGTSNKCTKLHPSHICRNSLCLCSGGKATVRAGHYT